MEAYMKKCHTLGDPSCSSRDGEEALQQIDIFVFSILFESYLDRYNLMLVCEKVNRRNHIIISIDCICARDVGSRMFNSGSLNVANANGFVQYCDVRQIMS